jgi:hypothetical protein
MQSDSNVTRQRLHTLWSAAETVSGTRLADFRSGLVPGQIIEIEQKLAEDRYAALIVGNAAGYGVARGLSDDEIVSTLPKLIAIRTDELIKKDRERVLRTVKRARARLHFVTADAHDS